MLGTKAAVAFMHALHSQRFTGTHGRDALMSTCMPSESGSRPRRCRKHALVHLQIVAFQIPVNDWRAVGVEVQHTLGRVQHLLAGSTESGQCFSVRLLYFGREAVAVHKTKAHGVSLKQSLPRLVGRLT